MPNRIHREDIVFRHPFALRGWAELQPAGTSALETEGALNKGITFPAWRRVSTTITRQPGQPCAVLEMLPVEPQDLARAQAAAAAAADAGGRA